MTGKIITYIIAAIQLVSAPNIMAVEKETIYFSESFDDGISDGFLYYDMDGCELHYTMTQLGFDPTDSWKALREDRSDNIYAGSASRFSGNDVGKKAADWLITPEIWIRSDNATFSWAGRSINENVKTLSSYEIRISTDGDRPEDFKSVPLTVVESETEDWEFHTISLEGYGGQKVRFAFVNTSANAEILGIDDIIVKGDAGLASIEIIPGDYVFDEEFNVKGKVTTCSEEPIRSIVLTLTTSENEPVTLEYSGNPLEEGDFYDFEFPLSLRGRFGDRISFTLKVEINGEEYETIERTTLLLAFAPEKKVVVEEGTGMWCTYCPEGIVAMETMRDKYPDTFIGIAIHSDDPLSPSGYPSLDNMFGAFPSMWVDRVVYTEKPMTNSMSGGKLVFSTLGGGIETIFEERMQLMALGEIKSSTHLEGNKLSISSNARFPFTANEADYRISYVIVEDHVWDEGYYQVNHYAGGDVSLGNFSELPPVITEDFEFNDVSRGVLGDYSGINIFPETIEAGIFYPYTSTHELPATVKNVAEASLITLLIDGKSGEIINADKIAIAASGVAHLYNAKDIKIRRTEDYVIASGEGNVEIDVYDISGKKIMTSSGDGEAIIRLPLHKGCFILKARDAVSGKSIKISL